MRFRSSFCGCLRICGHDKSDPYSCERIAISLLTVCNNVANIPRNAHERSVKCPHSPTKCPRTTPPGVGDRFIAPVSLYYQIYIFVSPNTCIYITITYFRSSFRGCLRIRGHDKSLPYSCKRTANNVANGLR